MVAAQEFYELVKDGQQIFSGMVRSRPGPDLPLAQHSILQRPTHCHHLL